MAVSTTNAASQRDRVCKGVDLVAKPKHLAILKMGVSAWNLWREGDDAPEEPNLAGANLLFSNLEGANVANVEYSTGSRQKKFRGIRAATCYGNQVFKSFAQDQDYIEAFRNAGVIKAGLFWLWWIFAECRGQA